MPSISFPKPPSDEERSMEDEESKPIISPNKVRQAADLRVRSYEGRSYVKSD